jgi:hypothetical protein
MDFNLPRYTEYFQENCNVDNLIDTSTSEACQVQNGKKILDKDYDELRTEWITNWNTAYDGAESNCKDEFITKLIEEITTTDEIRQEMTAEKEQNTTDITNRHANLSKINNSMEDIETNYLLGEQRLLETKGLNYINNAKFYIFIALIIILLLIQLMLILL